MQRANSVVGRVLLTLVVVLALTGLIVSCRAAATPSPTPPVATPTPPVATPIPEPTPIPTIDPRLTTLVIGTPLEANTFDPHVNVAYTSYLKYVHKIYETLVYLGPDGTLEPMLAQSWEVSEDGLVYRFKLREDVLFSDGTPFNAEAVRWSFDRFFTLGKGNILLFEAIDEVQVVDEYTVDIRLKEPHEPMLALLASVAGSLFVSPTAVEEHDEGDFGETWLYDHTAGTGPFMLESWEAGSRIELVRNPYYREPPASDDIQRMVYLIVLEPATQRLLLEGGDIDILDEVVPALVEPLEQLEGIEVLIGDTLENMCIFLNPTREPFDDVNFRRAIAYSVDYDGFSELYGGWPVGQGPFPPAFSPWFSSEDAIKYHQDLDKAADLLREAGYSVPIDPPLKLEILWQAGRTTQRDAATLMKEDLSKLGIDLEIVEMEIPVWRERLWEKEYDMLFIKAGAQAPDPDSSLTRFVHSESKFNPGYYNDRVDELIEQGRREGDREKRREIYNEVQRILTSEVPVIFYANLKMPVAYGSNLTGVRWNINYAGHFNFHGAEIKKTAVR